MALLNLQKTIFTIKELLSGNKIINNLEDIDSYFKGNNKFDHLEKLLKHAVSTTVFYKLYDSESISNFPVINKTKIKERFSDFSSSKFSGKSLIEMTTSGSTGTPFRVFQNREKKHRNLADTLYFANLAGYELGHKLVYFKVLIKAKMSPKYMYRLQNIILLDVLKLDESAIQLFIDTMENDGSQKHSILGYVSALESIIRYCHKINKKTIDASFKSVITMSEGLSKATKENLSTLFNCPVVSRYSNIENGIIAQQLINEEKFLINTASYYIEIMDFESDTIVENGVKGRIVVTDFFNYAMPLIRYDTGDVGALIIENGKSFLSSVEGRKIDLLFDTNDKPVSSTIIYKIVWQYHKEINEYQLIQLSKKDYVFKINCDVSFNKENQLISGFKSYLGSDANFTVEYVDKVPLLDSGKRRKIVNLYKNSI